MITVLLIGVLPFILAAGVIETIRKRGVALNAVAGALTLYLLLGLLFGALFLLVNEIGSAPFFANHTENVRSGDFIYFAFTTQTTVGFGDFVPGHRRRARARRLPGGGRPDVPRHASSPS